MDSVKRLLRCKIPPVFQMAFWSALVWVMPSRNLLGPYPNLHFSLVLGFLIIGAFFSLAGVYEFRRHQTTVHPMEIEKSSSLVQSGIYKWSRNPMYVGFLFFIIAQILYRESYFSIPFCFLYCWYMSCFQIVPEEQALVEKFGPTYEKYKGQVRRWL